MPQKESFKKKYFLLLSASKMRFFHFLDAVCLFVVAAFILLETEAQPKTSTSNAKLENEPAEQKNPDASPKKPASLELTVGNHWNSKSDACHEDLTLSMPVQSSDKSKGLLVVKHKPVLSNKCSSVFAVQPIPKTSSGIFYYEVAILGRKGFVSIGFATKQMQLDNEVGVSEGYAYEGCGLFVGNYSDNSDFFGEGIEPIIAGDIVGCGVDFKNKKIFYTLNGNRLGPAGEFVPSDDELFPCVSLSQEGDEIEANFGPDFKFKKLLKWDEIVNKDLLPKD